MSDESLLSYSSSSLADENSAISASCWKALSNCFGDTTLRVLGSIGSNASKTLRLSDVAETIFRLLRNRAKDYLTNSRDVDAGRIITRNGGYRNEVGAELYVVPSGGAQPPSCPTIPRCKKPKPTKQ
jgi:hypothetical protein